MHAVRGQQDVPAKARRMRGSARSPLEPWTCRPGFREFGAGAGGGAARLVEYTCDWPVCVPVLFDTMNYRTTQNLHGGSIPTTTYKRYIKSRGTWSPLSTTHRSGARKSDRRAGYHLPYPCLTPFIFFFCRVSFLGRPPRPISCPGPPPFFRVDCFAAGSS